MNKWISLVLIPLLTVFMLLLGNVLPVLAQEGTADLAITKTTSEKNIRTGENVVFTISVTNLGPDTATNIVFGDAIPDPLNFVSSSCDKGTVFLGFCNVDSLAVGESVTIILVVTPIPGLHAGQRKFSNTAVISISTPTDPNTSNNLASVDLHVIGNPHQ
jgi:uncharacterized repeat protein (TIGR01451 family)